MEEKETHSKKKKLKDIEKSKLEVLLKEYDHANSKIEKFVGNQFLYTQGALVLIGGYIIFLGEGIKIINNSMVDKSDAVLYLQFLPFLVLIIFSGILYQYQRTIGLQGYKMYLEFAINKMMGKNLISYAHIGMKHMVQSNGVALMNAVIYFLVYIVSCCLVYTKRIGYQESYWYVYHIVAFIIFMLIAIFSTNGYAEKIKEEAIAKYNSEEVLEN